jgi:hypothetical protein
LIWELSLHRDDADHAVRGDDRARAVSVRQAAEALFKPKPPALKPPEAHLDTPNNPQSRQPRVLVISAPERRGQEHPQPSRPVVPEPQKRIADAEIGRVRAWVKYGMTIPQVAQVYGVTLTEVQRVLREGLDQLPAV